LFIIQFLPEYGVGGGPNESVATKLGTCGRIGKYLL
jgi:hypothetical protein